MKETSYYELKMPDSNDTIDVSVLNNNMKRLDDVLILTVIGRTAETSEFVKKCCAPYIMIQNLGEETVTIYDRRWPEDMWEDNKIVIEPTKFYTYKVANSVNANFLVLDNKECNFRYFITAEQAIAEGGGGGGGGTTDYNELDNQPKVNGIVLIGNKSFKELGLLNDDGKIKSDFLPPFVDNMDSYDTEADFPRPGVEDRLYLDKSTNLAYVWAGTDYACIGTPLALGITHETAGYGDESRAAYNHSLSEHARVDATKTEASSVNGKIKINGTDVDVYTHPQAEGQEATNPHGTTASDVGLGNLLNAKQVTVTEQAYSDTEKAQARKNIGAGTSSFSGKYSDLAEIPSEFTPAEHNHDDLYAHKTSVSSANKTTSTIAITDNSQMAMVASIKGKTQKVVQFANKDTVTITSGGNARPAVTAERSFIANHIYYVTANQVTTLTSVTRNTFALSEVGGQIILFENSGENYHLSAGRHDWRFSIDSTKNCTISYWIHTPNTAYTLNNVMVFDLTEMYGAGKEPTLDQCKAMFTSYIPQGSYLWNAPVESVVSVGKNLIDYARTKLGYYDTSGNWNNANHIRCTDRITVQSGKRYYLSGMTGEGRAIFWNGNTIVSNPLITPPASVVAPVGATEMIFQENASGFPPTAQIEEGTAATPYTPYNKTTVLVPSEARNCVGYGLGISDSVCNIYDCENSVYTQMLNEVDFGSLSSWSYNTSTKEFSIAKPSDCPAGVWTEVPSILTGKYTTYSNQYFDANTATLNNAICLTATSLKIKDTAYTNADTLKAALTGQKLVYKLASTVTKALTDFIRPLPVEAGGTLTLVNEHNLDVNSTVKYKKEVN